MHRSNQLFNSLIHQLSAEMGMTIPDSKIAELLGIAPATLSRYRSGAVTLEQLELLIKLVSHLPSDRWILELEKCVSKSKPVATAPESTLKTLAKGALSLFSKTIDELSSTKTYPVRLGSMRYAEGDLYTNFLVTGCIGSGKSSAVITPLLRQLITYYTASYPELNHIKRDAKGALEDAYGGLKLDPRGEYHTKESLGGLILDSKGEHYENIIYFMARAGRNVLTDFILITPEPYYTVLEFRDPKTQQSWFLANVGTESELNKLSCKNKAVPVDFFDQCPNEDLQRMEFKIESEIRFIGWRNKNGILYPISHTEDNLEINKNGLEDINPTAPPTSLIFAQKHHIPTGIAYNICAPHLPAAEVAHRLIAIAESLGNDGGENPYWTDSAKKTIGFVIFLWRALHEEPCTALEILRLITQKSALDEQLELLKGKLEVTEVAINTTSDEHSKKELEGKKRFLIDIERFFTEEWAKLDSKTKDIIISTISNLFGGFISDSKLQEVFCRPSTFSFESAIQEGKIFSLLTGGEYGYLAKQLGTALKIDFQSIAKARTSQAHLNKKRPLLYLADEGQLYATAGGGNNTGDENFMALSRQSRVINIIATQSDSSIISVIGEKKAPVYFQSFSQRIWLQNTDYTTNQNATRVLGKTKKEKITSNGKEVSLDTFFSKDEGSTSKPTYEDDERFKLETFSQLDVFDAIVYNKDKKGIKDKACKYKGVPDIISLATSEESIEKKLLVRWYFQALIENRIHSLGLDILHSSHLPKKDKRL